MSEPDGAEHDTPQQLVLMRQLVELSAQRTKMSAERSEMSAERSYMNAERTLSVWVRTSLASMVVGMAVDRLGLSKANYQRTAIGPDTASTWVGAALVAFGVLITVVVGIRFWLYATKYCRNHVIPYYHGPYMGPAFALFAGLFGVVLLVLVLTIP